MAKFKKIPDSELEQIDQDAKAFGIKLDVKRRVKELRGIFEALESDQTEDTESTVLGLALGNNAELQPVLNDVVVLNINSLKD